MAKLTIVISGGNQNYKTVNKDGITYAVKELKETWKLVSINTNIKIELIFSKKDVPTQETLIETLNDMGYAE